MVDSVRGVRVCERLLLFGEKGEVREVYGKVSELLAGGSNVGSRPAAALGDLTDDVLKIKTVLTEFRIFRTKFY